MPATLLLRSLPLWPASPHLRAHTQKNTQWFITAAWKGWIIHSGIPKPWVSCSFITCSALDYRQLPFPRSLSLMGEQVFNPLCCSLFTHPPRAGLHPVCAHVCFNESRSSAKSVLHPSANTDYSHCSDAITTNKDHVIRYSRRAWETLWQDPVSEKQLILEQGKCTGPVPHTCASAELHPQNNVGCTLFFL